mgnify:CR=1 FL=1
MDAAGEVHRAVQFAPLGGWDEALLAEAGSDATRILQCTIWLADMSDFAEMNAVWDAWVPKGHAPARACGEAKLATPDYRVELLITAAQG